MSLTFRKIQKKDVFLFSQWGEHKDPRFYHYNFPYREHYEFIAWYYSKQKWISKKVFGLFLDDYPLGFITLKNMQWFNKSAELGIAIDPNHLSEGFGTELLKRFLDHVFNQYPIETMKLRVAHFNGRAIKSYEKIGFKITDSRTEPFEEQGYRDIIIKQFPEQFTLVDDCLFTDFYLMEIHKSAFMK